MTDTQLLILGCLLAPVLVGWHMDFLRKEWALKILLGIVLIFGVQVMITPVQIVKIVTADKTYEVKETDFSDDGWLFRSPSVYYLDIDGQTVTVPLAQVKQVTKSEEKKDKAE